MVGEATTYLIPHSDIYLFADDAKLFRHITQNGDKTALQKGVNAVHCRNGRKNGF